MTHVMWKRKEDCEIFSHSFSKYIKYIHECSNTLEVALGICFQVYIYIYIYQIYIYIYTYLKLPIGSMWLKLNDVTNLRRKEISPLQ